MAAKAQAARLIRQGSNTVELGDCGRSYTLPVPVDIRHVLVEPFDITLLFSQFTSGVAFVGVTAVLQGASGITITADPNNLAGAFVVAELAGGEPLGPGGTCQASEPDTSRVVAHVRAPAADPRRAQLPRGFQFFCSSTHIQVKSLYKPPAAPQEFAALEGALRDLQARVAALEAGWAPSPAQHSERTIPGAVEAPSRGPAGHHHGCGGGWWAHPGRSHPGGRPRTPSSRAACLRGARAAAPHASARWQPRSGPGGGPAGGPPGSPFARAWGGGAGCWG